MPTQVLMGKSKVAVNQSTRIIYQTRLAPREIETTLEPLGHVLAGEIELLTGFRPQVIASGSIMDASSFDIQLRFNEVEQFVDSEVDEDQSYQLAVGQQGITVDGQYYKGVAYGTATLLQSLIFDGDDFSFPELRINDNPHANYRGVMIDVARKPHSTETLREIVRMARLYKLRYIHLHLTDDQNFTFPFGPIIDTLNGNFSYTREELVELVAYADARGVTLIPEMDLPGHSSRLRQSGYLDPSESDADVADPKNYAKIAVIIDDMLSVFGSTPYFHIGGDESRAGNKLTPFLVAMNKHLRGLPEGQKRTMMVWEGFHGAPTDILPATGPDRVVVHSWESAYNPPWALLDSGYTIINSSWKPLYVVGGGVDWHPGGAVRMWEPDLLYRWNKDIFMHWEPGRPVYNDADPDPQGDDDRTDHQWSAAHNQQQDQVLGGQLIFWEQREESVIRDLRDRLPAVAERLWNPNPGLDYEGFVRRWMAVDDRVMTIVRPVEILPGTCDPASPMNHAYRIYKGDEVRVSIRNRTRVTGHIRYEIGSFNNEVTRFGFRAPLQVSANSTLYDTPFDMSGGFSIRAKLFRKDGSPVEGNDWQLFNNWPNRVGVTEFDIGNRLLDEVPDLSSFGEDRELRQYEMPTLRGPMNHNALIGQMFNATFTAPGTGDFTFYAKTRRGHASVYFDLNQNGEWDEDEKYVDKTPRNEDRIPFTLYLTQGEQYPVRVDHVTHLPGLVVTLQVSGPGVERGLDDSSAYFELLDRADEK